MEQSGITSKEALLEYATSLQAAYVRHSLDNDLMQDAEYKINYQRVIKTIRALRHCSRTGDYHAYKSVLNNAKKVLERAGGSIA